MNKLIAYFVDQGAFVNIITILVVVAGGYSLFNINREVFPNIQFDVITVTTAFPGGAAESLERLVTNPLEQDFRELDGIKKMNSFSVEGQSVIVLQLDPDQTTVEQAKIDIEDIVSGFTDLPDGAYDPVVTVMESKIQPIVQVSLSGEVSEEKLRETAKYLEREIEKIREVAKVSYTGLRDYEIRIEAHTDKLKKFRISLTELIGVIERNNINIPGGTLSDGDHGELIVRTIGEYQSVTDVENTVIRANSLGQTIRIKDVCDVKMSFADAKYLRATNGSKSINLTVMRKEHSDAIVLVDTVKETVAENLSKIDPRINVSYINDSSYYVKRRLAVLFNNMLVGLVLVLIILSFVLPLPVALVTVFGIPFAFLAVLAIFHFGNISLNLISMMGLIIVVGMLVDDAIVITENAQRFIEDGHSPYEAAIKGTQRIWAPVTASVMTTVIVFAPMMFMTGIFGKFIYFIPLAVIISLLVSLWECFFILPHHVASWVRLKKTNEQGSWFNRKIWQPLIATPYLYLLGGIIKLRYLVLLVAAGLFAGMIYIAVNKVGFILFPPGAIDMFTINFQAEVGTPLVRTRQLINPYEQYLTQLPDNELNDFTTTVGSQGEHDVRNMKRGSEYGQIIVYLSDELSRQRSTLDIIETMRKEIEKPAGLQSVNFKRIAGGPPVGKPVNISVRGVDYSEILPFVERLEQELATIDGVSDIENSYVEGKEEVRIRIDQRAAAAVSLSLVEIGTAIRAAFEGTVPTTIRSLDEEIDLRVTLHGKHGANTLDKIEIPNRRGNLIALPKVASWSKDRGVSVYEHEDNQRQVTVTAEIDNRVTNSRLVNDQMRNKITELEKGQQGVSFHFGGEDLDTKESMQSLQVTFIFALFGIILLLILLFKNIYQPFIIATTIPLGIVAVIFTFFVHQKVLSFLAMIGIIALAGVIVNNAIVFIDFINRARREGMDKRASIKDAASRRLRPIFLTTITTSAGILPTAYGIGGLDPFVVPIAISLGWGILGGALLTILVLPAVIVVVDDIVGIFAKIFRRRKNEPVSV